MVFRDTPTESEWQAVQAYFHDNQPESTKNMALLRLDDPVAEEDFYQLPNGVTLDLDEDGVQEHILAVGHPEACDREGCDVYLLEGDLKDLRIDKVLICGGGARLRGLRGLLRENLRCPVELFDPFANLDLSALSGDDAEQLQQMRHEAVIALGLAVGAPRRHAVLA